MEYIHQHGERAVLKKKSLTFVDKLWLQSDQLLLPIQNIDSNQQLLIGPPDFRTTPANSCFKLGYREELIISFKDRLIQNEKGKDLFVFNAKEMNGLQAYVSENGKRWKAPNHF